MLKFISMQMKQALKKKHKKKEKKGGKIIKKKEKKEKMSRQTLTHCGKYSDQNQEADFHLELAQSAKIKM
jgi:hypothetical protein